jgi:hypothetical protein
VLLNQAATLPQFTGHRAELYRERRQLLPPCDDVMARLVWWAYLVGVEEGMLPLRHLADALAAGAELCAVRQDAEGFQQIVADWRWLTGVMVREGDTLIDQMVARVLVTTPLANFRDAARELGLEAEAAEFAAREQLERTEREARERAPGRDLPPHERGSLLARGLITPSVIRVPPELTEQDLRPGRLADHAAFDRASAMAAWWILGVGAVGAGWFFRRRVVIRALAVRMLDLLRPSDWGWLLLGGVAAPVLWYLAVTRLTPLSAREWSLGSSGFLLPVFQKLALVLLLMLLPLVVAGWRLGKRGAVFGLVGPWPGLGWLAAGAAALAIPALGLMVYGSESSFLAIAVVLLGGPSCWYLGAMFQYAAGRKSQDLRRAAVVRAAVPAWHCTMLLCALALPLHHAEERHWTRRDELLAVPPDRPALSGYEARLASILREETLDMMAAPEAPNGR